MIDLVSLGLSHALMLLAAWKLFKRDDLDHDDPAAAKRPAWGQRPDA